MLPRVDLKATWKLYQDAFLKLESKLTQLQLKTGCPANTISSNIDEKGLFYWKIGDVSKKWWVQQKKFVSTPSLFTRLYFWKVALAIFIYLKSYD